jgi:adenylate cyclase
VSGAAASKSRAAGAVGGPRSLATAERAARLWSGLILFAFAASHFVNHALGVFGLDAMTAFQGWRWFVWRSWPGSILLAGAAIVHASLALKRAASRRTWRMPPLEALQIVLGLLIPFMLVGHVVATRVMSSLGGVDDSYLHVLRNLWPGLALWQSAALLIVWAHGCIGIHSAFHMQRWFRLARVPLAILAALVPALALAGFAAAGREALGSPAPWQAGTDAQAAIWTAANMTGRTVIYGGLALVAALVGFRFLRARLGNRLTIRYLGHGEAVGAPGQTLLEISRDNGVPHPSACGGRGRCSSCRVLVLEGADSAPPPAGIEKRMLERIRAPQQIRLACQLRPTGTMKVRVMLGLQETAVASGVGNESLDWGINEPLTILFADVRGFATLAQHQLPADLLILLNRVIGEMTQAVESRGGQVASVQTDGIMALFGMGGKGRGGARAALNAATDILKAIHLVNKDVRAALPLPVRVGIGIDTGEVTLSRLPDGQGGFRAVIIGEAVVVADRLEAATKENAADCMVSARTIAAAGLKAPTEGERQIHYKNGAQPMLAHAFSDRQALRIMLGRTGKGREAADAAAPAPAAAEG